MAQQQKMVTFSPSSSSSAASHVHHHPHKYHHQHSFSGYHHTTNGGAESGYASGLSSSSRPLDGFSDSASMSLGANSVLGEVQTTPRTSAAINYMSALQLSTPRMNLRSGRKGTPLKRTPSSSLYNHSMALACETTPKKHRSHENIENETSHLSMSRSTGKVPFRTRLDRSLSHPMSPLLETTDKLDCTFDAISSSTPICQPFRAEFYEQQVEEIPLKNLPRSGGKNTRTKLIRKMQSFSPRKLMGLRAAKVPLREMDQNSVDFQTYSAGLLFPVEEEDSSPILKASGGGGNGGSGGAVKKILFTDNNNHGMANNGGAFSNGLRDLMFGAIKLEGHANEKESDSKVEPVDLSISSQIGESEKKRDAQQTQSQESSSQLLDLYVTNLSNLDGGDSNSHPPTEDGDVSMNTSMTADVERYFDELKRNTTQALEQQQQQQQEYSPLKPSNSWNLYEMLQTGENNTIADEPVTIDKAMMDVEGETEAIKDEKIEEQQQQQQQQPVATNPPMLLRKRKRPSTELIQAVLATPKKMRRSQSFAIGDHHGTNDENAEQMMSEKELAYPIHFISPPGGQQRLGGARKRLNYEPVARNRLSPAKRHLTFDGAVKRRSLNGTSRLNIFRHLANCPPVRDYFFEFVDDKDLVCIYAVSRQCRTMIESHPKLNARRLQYLEVAWRKKENSEYSSISSSSSLLSSEDSAIRISEPSIIRIPLNNRNVDTSCASSINETMSPPVSPSRRKFHENQKLVQQNPGAFFVPCPRCRSCSVIEQQQQLQQAASKRTDLSSMSRRSHSMCASDFGVRNTSLMIPVRKQLSLPETNALKENGTEHRVGLCQSVQCGFRFCVHCSYAFETGHKCVEIGTLSPLIKQSRQPRVVACSKQSKRNLKRL